MQDAVIRRQWPFDAEVISIIIMLIINGEFYVVKNNKTIYICDNKKPVKL